MTIQWFPGHMAKARRQVTEKLKLMDVVIELLDARLPFSSRNPMIREIVEDKPRLVLLNKADLADSEVTKQWLAYFKEIEGSEALAIDAQSGTGVQKIPTVSKAMMKEMFDKRAAKGMQPRAVRALIIGIPNVGKSSLINRLAKRNIAKTGDRPGVTKAQQWIKVGKEMELLDTPGILWPKFEDPQVGLRLAASGAIKDEIIDLQEVAVYAVDLLKEHYANRMEERYGIDPLPDDRVEILDRIGEKRGCLMRGGMIDYEKVCELFIRELRAGKLGPITFETPEEYSTLNE